MLNTIKANSTAYCLLHSKDERSNKGQFFTSVLLAEYMAASLTDYFGKDSLRILDPGAGNGMLSAALTMELAKGENKPKAIDITMVENDTNILPLLKKTVALIRKFSRGGGIKCTIRIKEKNFLTEKIGAKYDIVISNPPYKKIRKDSKEAKAMERYVHGQPNLYGLFMGRAIDLLAEGGGFVFITPRSWTSGNYYKKIREHIASELSIDKICIFESRDAVFSGEDVLQETMIMTGRKCHCQKKEVKITTTTDDTFSDKKVFSVNAKDIINVGAEKYLLIPSNQNELEVLRLMNRSKKTFADMGYVFKTGPVVEFRNQGYIHRNNERNTVPMFKPSNIQSGHFVFPVAEDIEDNQFVSRERQKLLIKNENTVLIKRTTTKEENKRLQCCVYNNQLLADTRFVSIENHVNYLVKKNGETLTEEETAVIGALLSSNTYEIYFRMVNGTTQVNATELNNLPLSEEVLN